MRCHPYVFKRRALLSWGGDMLGKPINTRPRQDGTVRKTSNSWCRTSDIGRKQAALALRNPRKRLSTQDGNGHSVAATVIRSHLKGEFHAVHKIFSGSSGLRGCVDRSGPLCRNVETELCQEQVQDGDATERADHHLLGGRQRPARDGQGNLIRWPGALYALQRPNSRWNGKDH